MQTIKLFEFQIDKFPTHRKRMQLKSVIVNSQHIKLLDWTNFLNKSLWSIVCPKNLPKMFILIKFKSKTNFFWHFKTRIQSNQASKAISSMRILFFLVKLKPAYCRSSLVRSIEFSHSSHFWYLPYAKRLFLWYTSNEYTAPNRKHHQNIWNIFIVRICVKKGYRFYCTVCTGGS